MNILPKKSWHVRTKKNIDRVRKDEAEAAAKEKELQKRAKVAELEVSLDALRKKNADACDATGTPDVIDVTLVNPSGSSGAGHLNLFRDIEIHEGKLHGANVEAELDKKREAEDWEKKVGILQYLGQSTGEGQRFYQKNEKTVEQASELSAKQQRMKDALDPMSTFPKYAKQQLHTVPKKRRVEEFLAEKKIEFTSQEAGAAGSSKDKSRKRGRSASSSSSSDDNSDLCRKRGRKRKKHSKHKLQTKRRKSPSSESDPESEEERKKRKKANLEILRKQRLEREERERKRTQEFLSSLAARSSNDLEEEKVDSERNRRYNSQYNPHLARY